MDFTKQEFVRWVLLSVTVIFAATLAVILLTHFGYLHFGSGITYTSTQIIAMAVIAAIPGIMFVAHRRGYESAAGMAILALIFSFPLFPLDDVFRYSMPQFIWMPFALALAICSIRWAILTFVTTLAVLFAFFPVANTKSPITTAAITAVIFTVLTLGKLLQESLTAQALASEKAARDSESALRKSEERYRTVFQHTIDAITISRLDDGIYLEANDAFFEMTGYRPEEIIGHTSLAQKIWGNLDQMTEMLDLLSRHGEVKNFEACFRRKNGELYWGLLSCKVMDIDGVPCRIAVNHDITEHKKG